MVIVLVLVMATFFVMLSAGVKGPVREDLLVNSICSFPVASCMTTTGPYICRMLRASHIAGMLLNGACVEVQAKYRIGKRFGAVSAMVVLRRGR